jgi:hypothetical protein
VTRTSSSSNVRWLIRRGGPGSTPSKLSYCNHLQFHRDLIDAPVIASALTLHFNVKRVYLLEYHGSVMSRYLGSPSAIASHSLINSSNSGEDDDSFSFARASASEVK